MKKLIGLLNATLLLAHSSVTFGETVFGSFVDFDEQIIESQIEDLSRNTCSGKSQNPLNDLGVVTSDAFYFLSLDSNEEEAKDRLKKIYKKHNCNPDLAELKRNSPTSNDVLNDFTSQESASELFSNLSCLNEENENEGLNEKEGCLGVRELEKAIKNGEVTPLKVYEDFRERTRNLKDEQISEITTAGILIGVVTGVVSSLIASKLYDKFFKEEKPEERPIEIHVHVHKPERDTQPTTDRPQRTENTEAPSQEKPEENEAQTPEEIQVDEPTDSNQDDVNDDNTDENYPPKEEGHPLDNLAPEAEQKLIDDLWNTFLEELAEKQKTCQKEEHDPHYGVRNLFEVKEDKCNSEALKQELAGLNPERRSVHAVFRDKLAKEYQRKAEERDEAKQELIRKAPQCDRYFDLNLIEACEKERADYFKKHDLKDPKRELLSRFDILIEEPRRPRLSDYFDFSPEVINEACKDENLHGIGFICSGL